MATLISHYLSLNHYHKTHCCQKDKYHCEAEDETPRHCDVVMHQNNFKVSYHCFHVENPG